MFYLSRATGEFAEANVRGILVASQRNNRRRDITGCLIFTGRHFAQTLEGSDAALTALTARLFCDPRHTDHRVVVDRSVQLRQYPEWSMAYLCDLALVVRLEAVLCGELPAYEEALELMSRMKADSVLGSL